MVENLQEDSLIALCLINDFMTANDEAPVSLSISNNLVSSYKSARTKYQVALDEQQKNKKITGKVLKRTNIDEQLKDINSKRQKIMCIGRDGKRSDELSLKADEKTRLFAKGRNKTIQGEILQVAGRRCFEER